MKKTLISFAVIIIAGIAWYTLSPLLHHNKAEDASPLATNTAPIAVVHDALNSMNKETKQAFEQKTEEMKNVVIKQNQIMPEQAQLVSMGQLIKHAHDVQGKALLISQNGKKTLRFENLKTIDGPNVHIYLSTDLSDKDFVELGHITANEGNVNYDVPKGTDTDKYNKVLIWCKDFSVLFSYAELIKQ